jgi:rod shape-determining protein MreC
MRNFILLIRKYHFFIIFLLLQGLSFYLIVTNNSYQRSVYVTTSNNTVGKIYSAYSQLTDYLKLGVTNRLLAEENARLRKADSANFYDKRFTWLKTKDSLLFQQYEYITARVINNSVNRVNNYLTLDKGLIHGIRPYMAVACGSGVVGIVKDVSPHFSTVTSMLHSDTRISSKIKRNEYFGTTVWSGNSPSTGLLRDIPSHAKVAIGDTIITSTYSGIFPRGIFIGRVQEIGAGGESFKEIKIRFSTDFQNLSYVYVIRNILKEERDSLENKIASNVD